MTITEWEAVAVNVADDSTTVSAVPALLNAIFINTALSAQPLLIKDGTTTVYTIPASAAAGTRFVFGPTRFNTSLIVDPDNSGSGSITVEYADLERS